MKLSLSPEKLKLLTLGAGGLGLALRALLFLTGIDEKGLLEPGHIVSVLLWLVSIIVLAGLFLLTRKLEGSADYTDAFPTSGLAPLGALAAAIGIGITAISGFSRPSDLLTQLRNICGILAAVSMVFVAYCRLTGRKPVFLFHGILCVFMALDLVCRYRQWSSDPQLQDYVFHLLACIFLMLTAYQQAAFDADMGNHKILWLTSLIGVYLCCVSLWGGESLLYFLTGGIWAYCGISSLVPRRRRTRPTLTLEPDETGEETP